MPVDPQNSPETARDLAARARPGVAAGFFDTAGRAARAPLITLPLWRHEPVPSVATTLLRYDDTVQPGSVLGPYEIMEQLGAGGMGAVYRARDTRLGREVALKVIRPESTSDPVSHRRLLNEARAASALNHPNVVTVYEASTIGGVDFIAMELIVGETLATRILRGRLPLQEVFSLAIQVAEGLTAAHQAGLVHRDLKPSNIMITNDGRAKILDFGLARKTEISEPSEATLSMSLTIEGTVLGTMSYMSPEQARGEISGPPSDIFTYGAVLYETLCGTRPFEGKSQLDVFHQICFENPVPIAMRRPETPPALAAIIAKALAKKPADRFRSMSGIVDVLRILVLPDPASPLSASTMSAMAPVVSQEFARFDPAAASQTGPGKRWRKRILIGLGAAAAIVAGAVAIYRLGSRIAVESVPAAMLTRITYDTGLTGYPAISSDGKLVAYASDRAGGNLDIWVQQLGGGKPARLTTDPADDYQPSFSPDGTHVAYRSDRRSGGVYISPAFAGNEELLIPGGFDPKYSPDGNTLAGWRGYIGGALYPGAAQIVLVPLRTRQPQVFRPDFETTAYPIWLSNSRLLFLGRKKNGRKGDSLVDWWVADIAGGDAIPTGALLRFEQTGLRLPTAAYWFRPEAQAGGAVFFTAAFGDAVNIWQIRIDPQGRIAGPPTGVTFGASLDASVGVTGSGYDRTVVFSSLSLVRNVWKVGLTESGTADGPPKRLLSDEPQMNFPTVSVDGKTMSLSAREPDGHRIIIVDLGTMQQTLISGGEEWLPVLSGDGRRAVFWRDKSAFLTTVQEGQVTKLMKDCGKPTHATFDAGEVLCESTGADEKLLLWSRGTVQTLVHQPDGRDGTQYDGHFSPDGRWVVFSEGKRTSPERHIVVVPNAPNRKLAPDEWIGISDGGDTDRVPVWAANGKTIYYFSERDGFRCIWARPVDPATARPTGPSYPLAHFHLASQTLRMMRAGDLSLSASRGFLVFTLSEMSGNIWMQQATGAAK